MKTIAVVGVGTGGLLSLSHYLAWLPADWQVVSIHDPKIEILGIGESTTPKIPSNLYMGADFCLEKDAEELDATIKYYVKYTNWRKHDIYSLIDTGSHGIHFNNYKLKGFLFKRFAAKWGSKFKVIEAECTSIDTVKDSAVVTTTDKTYKFDYAVDCRGWPTDYSEYHISDCLPLNHCLVNVVNKPGDWYYTYHQATKNGWMFGVPTLHKQGWGYLYNDTITSKEDVIKDIADIFKQDKDNLTLKEYSFKPYRAKEIVTGRVLKNGNRFLFYEPLEALSTSYYDEANRLFFDYITGKFNQAQINYVMDQYAEQLELFVCYIYHGGSIYDTDFWRITKEKTRNRLAYSKMFAETVKQYREISSNPNLGELVKPFAAHSWFKLDKQFGYNYFCTS